MNYDTGNNIEINNIVLPPNVVRELQRLGRAMESYTRGELESAVIATHMDGNLIDDPNGVNFYDQLELTEAEKKKRANAHGDEAEETEEEKDEKRSDNHPSKLSSFRRRLLEARANRSQEDEHLANNG
jgi:hypothetical protein